jgi:hypothetical protein
LYSSRRCENKGQDARYWENYGRRGCANFYMERLCKLHYILVPGSCLVPQNWLSNYSKVNFGKLGILHFIQVLLKNDFKIFVKLFQ